MKNKYVDDMSRERRVNFFFRLALVLIVLCFSLCFIFTSLIFTTV